ncbi:MAG TPA: FGGY-family carbohydrate kinase [Actinomycetota bacterium]
MAADLIVAHDVGTTGSKAVLVDSAGRVLGSRLRTYPTLFPRPDWAEQEAEDWWGAVCATSRELLDATGTAPSRVSCMTFSSQLLGLVPMSSEGRVLRRPIIWLDNRACDQAKRVMRRFGGPRAFARLAGAELGGKDGIPKLVWLKEEEPDVYQGMSCFVDVNGYLLNRATDRIVMEWTGASVFGLDLKRKRWLTGVMRHSGIDPGKLPPLVRPIDVVGPLTKDAASACGLLQGTPVVAGAGDIPCSAVGAGAVAEGDGHLYIGSSGWASVVTSRTVTGRHGVAVIQSADPKHNLLMAEMETTGFCLQWIADELFPQEVERLGREEVFRMLDRIVEEVQPGSGSLVFTPWMYGERVPLCDTFVRGAFLNLGIDHHRGNLVRAVYEGVAFNFRWLLEVLEQDFGVSLPKLRVVGGGAKGRPWMQILADVTKRRVETVADPQDAGAVGAALTAAVGLGVYPDFASLGQIVTAECAFEPHPENAAVYDFLFGVYKEVYRDLRGLYRRVNRQRSAEADREAAVRRERPAAG